MNRYFLRRCLCAMAAASLTLYLAGSPAKAAEPGRFFTQAPLTMETPALGYLLYTPVDTSEKKPLIVYLHGNHSCGSDLELLKDSGLPAWLEGGGRALDAYVLCPQCPEGATWADITAEVKALMDAVVKECAVDTERISITGHSMGGAGVWSMLLAYGGLFYRAAPMSGGVKAQRLGQLPDIPYWIFAGDRDIAATISNCKTAAATLKRQGYDIKITLLANTSHRQVPERAYAKSGVLDWLTR